jgi:hypothetical protein
MICSVCGQDFGLTHNCAGIASAVMAEDVTPPPTGFAPLHYLKLAYQIVRWDDLAIRRASQDPAALWYGMAFSVIVAAAVFAVTWVVTFERFGLGLAKAFSPLVLPRFLIGLCVQVVLMAVSLIIQIGLCHMIAKFFLYGRGTFIGVLRPLLLTWMVNLLVLIPVVGMFALGLLWCALLMVVFEEVDGIRRMQAFLICYGIGFTVSIIGIILTHQ